jgi:PAS domain S-box-containing protein
MLSLSLAAGWVLLPRFGENVVYLVFPVALLIAVLWGTLPGVLTGAAGQLAADFLFVDPTLHLHFTPGTFLRFMVVVGSALVLGWVSDRLRAYEPASKRNISNAQPTSLATLAPNETVQAVGTRDVEQLQTSEARFRRLFQDSPILLQITAADGRILAVNSAWKELWGISDEIAKREALGGAFNLFEDPHLPALGILDQVRNVFRGGVASAYSPVFYDPAKLGKLGRARWVKYWLYPIKHPDGSIKEAVLMLDDVTEQQQAEITLRLLADASELLSSSLQVPVTLERVSRLALKYFGGSCVIHRMSSEGKLEEAVIEPAGSAVLTACLRELFRVSSADTFGPAHVLRTGRPEFIRRVDDPGDAAPGLLELLRAGRAKSYACVPMLERDRVWGTMTCVTAERHYAEEELSMADHLARRAGLALDNANLFDTAQEAIRLRDEFLSIASHELKTPLSSLRLQLEMLQRTTPASVGKTMSPALTTTSLEMAVRQVERLTKLVSELMDVSRISSGKLHLEIEEIDLVAVAGEVIGRFEEDAAKAGCEVILKADEPVPGKWDQFRIEQVVTNLLTNALKFGAGKPVELVVTRRGQLARLSVRDQGIGINSEEAKRLFQRFERTKTARRYGGFGLGLYIVRQILDAHGGTIRVESQPGLGATFTIELPLEPPLSRKEEERWQGRPSRELTEFSAVGDRLQASKMASDPTNRDGSGSGQRIQIRPGTLASPEAAWAILDAAPAEAAVSQDIAERMRASVELRASEARFRRVFEDSPIALQIISTDGRTLAVNRAWQELWQISNEEVEQRLRNAAYNVFEDPHLRSKGVLVHVRNAIQGEASVIPATLYDSAEKGKPGRKRWVKTFIYPIRHADGSVREVVLMHDNVTEQQRAHTILRLIAETSELHATSLQGATTLDRVSTLALRYFSDCCAIHEVSSNRTLSEAVVTSAHDPGLVDSLRALFRASAADTFGPAHVVLTGLPEYILRVDKPGDAAPRLVELLRAKNAKSYGCVPIFVSGRVWGTMTYIATERNDTDEETALAEQLARRAGPALENARLFDAAQIAIEQRDEFLSAASHELRTPLSSLSLQVEMLLRAARGKWRTPVSPATMASSLELATRQVDRLSRLVSELMDVSRISAGKLHLEMEEVDLAAVTRDVVRRFATEAAKARCELVLVANEPVSGRWDRFRMDQVVTNLLTNALKFGAGRPVELKVTREGDLARLAVRDLGIGIGAEDAKRLFQRFERATAARRFGGLGLGLYIVRQILDAHGGTIRVDSRLDSGATFTVELPLEPSPPSHVEGPPRQLSEGRGNSQEAV